MKNLLCRWFASLALMIAFAVPALAQAPGQPQIQRPGRAAAQDNTNVPEQAAPEHGPPAFQYFVALLLTILVLFLVCKPSGKTE